MIRKAMLLCIGLCCPIILFGQGQATHWYFGDGAGMRFEGDGSVTVLDEGKLATYEGCATISDPYGSLLFYTDGILVYNRDHELMENGTDLYGDSSSTQSAIIVPKPEDPDIYYIFCVDTASSDSNVDKGIHYSVVDLSYNNGLGAVTDKNIRLLGESSEKIAAVIRDCFDRSIWVVTMGSSEKESFFFDTLYAWKVTDAGVTVTPIKTTFPGLFIDDPRGYLKFSPDGSLLASANQTSGLYIFEFDLATGRGVGINRIEIPQPNHNPYGVEFSPDGRFLYVHTANEILPPRTNHYARLLQFDLDAPDIAASLVQLDEGPIFRGALQLGKNGKIYRTISKNYYEGTDALGVIHDPNAVGAAANYEHNAIDLGTKHTHQGLPPFVQSFFGKNNLVENDDGTTTEFKEVCEGERIRLQTDSIPGALYVWERDGTPLPGTTDFRLTINEATTMDAGTYSVEIISPDPSLCPILASSSIEVIPNPDTRAELVQCDYDLANALDGLTRMDLMAPFTDLENSFQFYNTIADRTADNPIADPNSFYNTQAFNQTVYYRSTNSLGCITDGEISVKVIPGDLQPSSIGPIYGCGEQQSNTELVSSFDLDYLAELFAPVNVTFFGNAEDLANDRNSLIGELISSSSMLYVRKENAGQCLGAEILELNVNPEPDLVWQENFALCANAEELVLKGPEGFNAFSWFELVNDEVIPISDEAEVRIGSPGRYRLEARFVYDSNASATSCQKQVDFQVTESERAVIKQVDIRDFSTNNTVTIQIDGDGEYDFSLDGSTYQDSPFFDNVEPGIMKVYVRDKNGCGLSQQEITVLGYPKFFTPNGDGVNDYWQLTGVNDEFEPDALIMIYDRYGALIAQISPTSSGWSGKSDAHMFPASDYWFRVILRSGREFTGHFALKR